MAVLWGPVPFLLPPPVEFVDILKHGGSSHDQKTHGRRGGSSSSAETHPRVSPSSMAETRSRIAHGLFALHTAARAEESTTLANLTASQPPSPPGSIVITPPDTMYSDLNADPNLESAVDWFIGGGWSNLKHHARSELGGPPQLLTTADVDIGKIHRQRDRDPVEEARALMEAAWSGPTTDTPLHRGRAVSLRDADFARYTTVGNEVDLPLNSFSSSLSQAERFRGGEGSDPPAHALLLTIRPGAHALHIAPMSDFPEEQEWIVSSRVKVVGHRETREVGSGTIVHHVELESIGLPATDVYKHLAGQHDQKTHGRRGGGVTESTLSRYESFDNPDGFDEDVDIEFQETFDNAFGIRAAAYRIIGSDKHAGDSGRWEGHRQADELSAYSMMRRLHDAPIVTLDESKAGWASDDENGIEFGHRGAVYRGIADVDGSKLARYKVGETFDNPLISFTPNQSEARSFGLREPGTEDQGLIKGSTVLLSLSGPAKTMLPAVEQQLSQVGEVWEVVSGGRFRVKKIHRRHDLGISEVEIEQVGTFDPHTGDLIPLGVTKHGSHDQSSHGNRTSTSPTTSTSLDARLVDYKPDRSLLPGTPGVTPITRVLPDTPVTLYSRLPFLATMHKQMGVSDPDAISIASYIARRDTTFDALPVRKTSISSLTVTQRTVNLNRVQEFRDDLPRARTKPIHAVRYQSRTYIINGHHRVVAEKMEGSTTMDTHLLDLDNVHKGLLVEVEKHGGSSHDQSSHGRRGSGRLAPGSYTGRRSAGDGNPGKGVAQVVGDWVDDHYWELLGALGKAGLAGLLGTIASSSSIGINLLMDFSKGDATAREIAAFQEVAKHLPGQHDQKTHGGDRGSLLSPHDQPPEPLPLSGKGSSRPDNPSATRFSQLSPDVQSTLSSHLLAASGPLALSPTLITANLDTLMSSIPPATLESGKHWYADAQSSIASHANATGHNLPTAIGMTAALSPQNEWGQNIAGAGFLMKTIRDNPTIKLSRDERAYLAVKAKGSSRAGTDIPDGTKFNDLTPEQSAWATILLSKRAELRSSVAAPTGKFPKVAWSCGTRPIAKAVRISRGESPDTVLAGHKVRSFHNNLTDPYNSHGRSDVTMDTHAISAASLHRMSATSAILGKMFGDSPEIKSANIKGTYSIFADSFRIVARSRNLEPNQAQAALWLHWQKVRYDYPRVRGEEGAEGLKGGESQRTKMLAGGAGKS